MEKAHTFQPIHIYNLIIGVWERGAAPQHFLVRQFVLKNRADYSLKIRQFQNCLNDKIVYSAVPVVLASEQCIQIR